jgi:hypothetical protein
MDRAGRERMDAWMKEGRKEGRKEGGKEGRAGGREGRNRIKKGKEE